MQNDLKSLEGNLFAKVKPHLENASDEGSLEEVKNYFLKNRYLLRIKENLNKFASL